MTFLFGLTFVVEIVWLMYIALVEPRFWRFVFKTGIVLAGAHLLRALMNILEG